MKILDKLKEASENLTRKKTALEKLESRQQSERQKFQDDLTAAAATAAAAKKQQNEARLEEIENLIPSALDALNTAFAAGPFADLQEAVTRVFAQNHEIDSLVSEREII